jgi:hypothetical protein
MARMTPARLILLGAAVTVLAACSALRDYHAANPDFGSSAPPYERIQFASQFATPAERARCEAAGGEVRQAGMLGWQHCIQTYPDAGQACRGSEDCLGQCRLDGTAGAVEAGAPADGICQGSDEPFGCYTRVENGRATQTICVD